MGKDKYILLFPNDVIIALINKPTTYKLRKNKNLRVGTKISQKQFKVFRNSKAGDRSFIRESGVFFLVVYFSNKFLKQLRGGI